MCVPNTNIYVYTYIHTYTHTKQVMIPPYEREIYVIAMIKKKILDHCNCE